MENTFSVQNQRKTKCREKSDFSPEKKIDWPHTTNAKQYRAKKNRLDAEGSYIIKDHRELIS